MNEYLTLLSGPLGLLVQIARGNGVPTKVLIPSTLALMVLGVWLGGAEGASWKEIAKAGLIWIVGTVSTMFGTAYVAYKYAAAGKNPEERSERAALPMVPVTDPNKTIVK